MTSPAPELTTHALTPDRWRDLEAVFGAKGCSMARGSVGWVAVAPRADYPRLRRSPVAKAVDDVPVWSIVCFVVPTTHRGQGVATGLLHGAIDFARARGAPALEAYPVDQEGPADAAFLWNGPMSMYLRAGFVEVARRRPERPVVRLAFDGGGTGA